MFEHTQLPQEQSGHLSQLVQDYLKGHPNLKSFYHFEPNEKGLAKALEARKSMPVDRETLVKVLLEQHANYEGQSAKLRENILALKHNNTYTVTTGHQLCLFTGPLYFIYKIASVIRLAEELRKKHRDCHVVPVFWMATEDHDFEEINHVHLFGKTLTWEGAEKGAVGRMNPQSMSGVLDEMEGLITREEKAPELMGFFREAYQRCPNLAEATRLVVQELFPQQGVVVLDADHPDLKKALIPVMEADIFKGVTQKNILPVAEKLHDLGFKTPVTPRPINFFYLHDQMRERIEQDGNQYQVLNTDIRFSAEEIKAEMQAHPERFSPNVALRPVYQERILPNLAYIGGPSEVAYWLELAESFVHHNTFFPVVLPRNFALVVPRNVQNKLDKLGLTVADLYRQTNAIVTEKVKEEAEDGLDLETEKAALNALYEDILQKLGTIDASLQGAARGEMQKAVKGLANLESKMVRAEKRKQETTVNQIKAVKDKLFPDGHPQERWDSIIPFYLRWGTRFIRELLDQFDPLDARMNVLVEERPQPN